MPIDLTVILGAGAAKDVVNTDSNQVVEGIFRPPTTADLFFTHRDWEAEFLKFPAVASTIEELRNTFPGNRTSIDIEDFLKKLKNSRNPHRNNQFREFPLYLQHFFNAVSTRYCRKPSNYLTLLNKIFDLDLGKVVFVTTNYDLLFDKALEIHPATIFSINDVNMNKYIAKPTWSCIKLHGSIDWGRRIKDSMIMNRSDTLSGLIDNVAQLGNDLENALEEEIVKDPTFNSESGKQLIYPAISVPIGESKLNCPEEHLENLRSFLNNCKNFLIVGFSGYDKDILKLLDEKEGGFGRVHFVSNSAQSASKARDKFFSYPTLGGKLQGHADIYDGNGFDEFVRNGNINGLQGFLNSLS